MSGLVPGLVQYDFEAWLSSGSDNVHLSASL